MNTKYLDKISQYMLDDTVMDYEQKLVIYPFIPDSHSQWGISTPLSFVKYDYLFFIEFSDYCKYMYGLTEDEIKYVWERYKVIFDHKINSKPMNESVDNKKEKYLDKIVKYLVEDTRIDYDEDHVTYPFIPNHKKSFYITPLTYVQEGSPFFSHFTNYCYNTYGLTDQEISYVWYHYSDIINDKLNQK